MGRDQDIYAADYTKETDRELNRRVDLGTQLVIL